MKEQSGTNSRLASTEVIIPIERWPQSASSWPFSSTKLVGRRPRVWYVLLCRSRQTLRK